MNVVEYEKIIMSTIWARCRILVIVLLIVIALLITEKIYYHRTKCNKGVTIWEMLGLVSLSYESRFTLREQMHLKYLGIIICIVMITWEVLPASLDMANNQYVCTSGMYHNNCYPSYQDFLSYGSVDFRTDSENLILDLPYDWNTADYPVGSYYANVVYGKHTKIIVYVEVISEANVIFEGHGVRGIRLKACPMRRSRVFLNSKCLFHRTSDGWQERPHLS